MNFFHDLNIAVITSRFVITHNSPIIYVSHNQEMEYGNLWCGESKRRL